MAEIDDALQETFASGRLPSYFVVGDAGGQAVARGLAVAAENCHVIVASREPQAWPDEVRFTRLELGDELTPRQAGRSALRMDPDVLVFEVERGELDVDLVELTVTAASTGHGVIVRVTGCADASPIREALGALLAAYPPAFASPLSRTLVCDAEGVAQVLDAVSGEAVWGRGQPIPEREALTGQEPPAPPPVREPTPPLEPQLLQQLRAALEGRLRPSYVPRVAAPTGDAGCSKVGGLALLAPGEAWPTCPNCAAPLPLALQLARETCPEPVQARFPAGARHLQLFYCSSSDCGADDAWEPFGTNRVLRFLRESVPASEVPECPEPPEPADLVGWDERVMTPHSEDVRDLSDELQIAREQLGDLVREGSADAADVPYASPSHETRLLGWPAWAQGAEWPSCPQCEARMVLVAQVGADDGPLRMLFAADGTGHVTQCPTHLDVLAFGWACG
ncbi:MAG: hypothetical protein R3F62_32110 [Planctomycetota bacterium]